MIIDNAYELQFRLPVMIIDTADETTPGVLQDLKAAGVTAIIRYYSASDWKRVTPSEARAIARAGLQMGAVYEDAGSTPSTFTVSNGAAHAARALEQAAACGQPQGSAIYFAVDFDASHTQISAQIVPYFQAVHAIIGGRFRIGAYASGLCCELLLARFPNLLPWITCSLGFNGTLAFLKAGKQALFQGTFNGGGVPRSGCDKVLYNLGVDYNTAHQDDWGQFVPFALEPSPPAHDIAWLQNKLGVTVDGVVGPNTLAAMIKFMEDHT